MTPIRLALAVAAALAATPLIAQATADSVEAPAVINSIGDGMANVTHGPIPEIGWPAMTMDLAVAPDAEMPETVTPGDEVMLKLVKGADGMYAIGAIMAE